METLSNGTLYIKTRNLEETADHQSRLSVRCMLNGRQYYKAGGNDYLVQPDNFLVINRGQIYRTQFRDSSELEMLMVAFNPGFARNVFYAMSTAEAQLMEDPFGTAALDPCFVERTYPADAVVAEAFSQLRKLIGEHDQAWKAQLDLDSIYRRILERLIILHYGLLKEVSRIPGQKQSVKMELYRRVMIARDHIDAHVPEALHIEKLSRIACLSPHHFVRSFRQVTGQTPHQYVISKKMEMARSLLAGSDSMISDICLATGFENNSSFIRLFRQRHKLTPEAWRKSVRVG
jgi:AraC family transcriptional regulator